METTAEIIRKMEDRANHQHYVVEAGQHDDNCEWATIFRICHCRRRKRLAEGKTEAPVMYYVPPVCEGCGKHCVHDGDGFGCPDCRVDFGNAYDEPGTWQDEWAETDAELVVMRDRAVMADRQRVADNAQRRSQ
jgi:hypothetical protein